MYRHVTTAVASFSDVIVAGVTYRLAPEHRFPSAAEDCIEATQWLYDHAEGIGGDQSKLAVMGDSAGG